jgi:hydroxyacylglutathione hydrolase
MRVLPVPCLSDNYAYLVHADGSRDALVVDPSEAAPVLEAAAREGLHLVGVLNTHHHHDHVGGNVELAEKLGVPVYAFEGDRGRVPAHSVDVVEGRAFTSAGLSFLPLHVPGHTTGAIAYVVEGAVFTGDTLFVAGCGRLFEGTAEMMFASFAKLAALPPTTKVYCGHEYTVGNLRFALTTEPDNAAMKAALESAVAKREKGEPTVPSTLADELATNPFVRAKTAADFGAIRAAKDVFRA